jgi:hypothetical protein
VVETKRRARSALIVGVLACVAVLGAGCGGDSDSGGDETSTVDVQRLEEQLRGVLTRSATPAQPSPVPGQPPVAPATAGIDVKSVACPENLPSRMGNKFKCEVDASNATGSVDVTQTDAAGKKFSYNAKLKQPGLTTTTRGTLDLNVTPSFSGS